MSTGPSVLRYLDALNVVDPVIIGGCLRSTALGINRFSDIDVALHATPGHGNEKLFNLLAKKNPAAVDHSKLRKGVLSAQHSLNIGNIPVDLTFFSIAASAPEKAARARVGICGLAMDKTGAVWATEAFRRDRDNRTITLLDGTKGDIAPRVFAYAARLQRDYFPGFAIVDGTADNPSKAVVKRPLVP